MPVCTSVTLETRTLFIIVVIVCLWMRCTFGIAFSIRRNKCIWKTSWKKADFRNSSFGEHVCVQRGYEQKHAPSVFGVNARHGLFNTTRGGANVPERSHKKPTRQTVTIIYPVAFGTVFVIIDEPIFEGINRKQITPMVVFLTNRWRSRAFVDHMVPPAIPMYVGIFIDHRWNTITIQDVVDMVRVQCQCNSFFVSRSLTGIYKHDSMARSLFGFCLQSEENPCKKLSVGSTSLCWLVC